MAPPGLTPLGMRLYSPNERDGPVRLSIILNFNDQYNFPCFGTNKDCYNFKICEYATFFIEFLPYNKNFQNTDTDTDTAVFNPRYTEYRTELGISNTAQLY